MPPAAISPSTAADWTGHPAIFYLPPDTLEWEDCELGYTDFLNWAFSGDLALFYENVR